MVCVYLNLRVLEVQWRVFLKSPKQPGVAFLFSLLCEICLVQSVVCFIAHRYQGMGSSHAVCN